MSDQEQYAIAGRALVEYGETKRNLAALKAKASAYANTMRAIANSLHRPADQQHTYSLRALTKEWNAEFEKFPDRDSIAELASEIQSATERLREIHKTMKDMGYEPKETD